MVNTRLLILSGFFRDVLFKNAFDSKLSAVPDVGDINKEDYRFNYYIGK